MICHQRKLIFIHIPKTGGTSIEIALGQEQCGLQKHELPSNIIWDYGRELWKSYYKFTFVRNPWDRLVSWYFFRIENNQFSGPFAAYLKHLDPVLCYTPWYNRQQVDWIERERLDFIGRFEKLNEDWTVVCQEANLGNIILPWAFKTHHRHYSHYYDDKTRDLVARWFKDDIETFHYTFESSPSPWGYQSWERPESAKRLL